MSPDAASPYSRTRSASELHRWLRSVRVALLVRRRSVAALCAAGAAWACLQVLAPAPVAGLDVRVAARDLPAGTVLRDEHVVTRSFADGQAPDRLVAAPVGRTLAAPVTRGEPFTEARVVSPGLIDHLDGRTAVPVRIEDPDVVQLLRVGDHVDAVAVDPRDGEHTRVASRAVVLSLPPDAGQGTGEVAGRRLGSSQQGSGRLVLLAVEAQEADAVAAAAARAQVHLLWR